MTRMIATGPRPTITPGEHVSARPGAFVVSTAFESTKCSVVGLATLHCTWETTPDPQPQAFHSTSAYHSNQQYSVYTLTNATGAVSERMAYTAYGQPTFLNASGTVQTGSANNNRYTYTGREWDATIGLHHFRARWMSPMGGRFLGRDPIGLLEDFQLYSFVTSAPLILLDPTGMCTEPPNCEGGSAIPKAKVTNKVVVSGPKYEPVDFSGTVRDVIDFGGKGMLLGTPGQVGDTIVKVDISSTFAFGEMQCKTCCCDGSAIFLESLTVSVNVDITVKYFNWKNPPEPQRRNWDRLKAAIIAHENHHVNDAKKLATQLGNAKPEIGPVYAMICNPNYKMQIASKMAIRSGEAAQAYQQSLSDGWKARWGKLMDDFHKSPTGRRIQIEDFIR